MRNIDTEGKEHIKEIQNTEEIENIEDSNQRRILLSHVIK